MKRKLRVHHLLCIPLFEGYGYSDAFSRNMQEQIAWLAQHRDENVQLVCEADMICEKCPHLTAGNLCKDERNQVAEKDAALLEALEIDKQVAVVKELFRFAGERMTEKIFTDSCKDCEWKKRGICSWEKYREKIGKFV